MVNAAQKAAANSTAQSGVNTSAADPGTPEEGKTRRKARTVDEQIADLKAKAEARKAKDKERNTTKLDDVEEQITKVEPKLIALLNQRKELRLALGWTADDNGDVNVPPSEGSDDEAAGEASDSEQS